LKSFAIGVVLALAILLLATFAPRLLQPSAERAAADARAQAETARRMLAAHSLETSGLAASSDLARLKSADFAALVQQAGGNLQQLSQEFSAAVQRAKSLDRRSNLPQTDLRPLSLDENGLRAAVASLERLSAENRQRLDEASREARQASQLSGQTPGVAEALGLTKLVEAQERYAEARRTRTELAAELGRLSELAFEAASAESAAGHYGAVNVADVVKTLQDDVAEVAAQHEQAAAHAARLSAAVAEREADLSRTRDELSRVRSELLSLEETGFAAGNDSAFDSYRQRYASLSARARELQEQEQLLSDGGKLGGEEVDRGLDFGIVEGGETVIGLEELRRELAIAEEKLQRLGVSQESLAEKARSVEQVGSLSQEQQRHLTELRDGIRRQITDRHARAEELAKTAMEHEDQALRAAQEAAQAFRSAAQAHSRWTGDARKTQGEFDKMRKNERLRLIVEDKYGEQLSAAGEADARTLAAMIHNDRLMAVGNLKQTLERVAANVAGFSFEAQPLDDAIASSREEAIKLLGESRAAYEKLAGKALPTSWIHQVSLAAVEHLLSKLDEEGAAQHSAAAIQNIRQAINKREQSPYVSEAVLAFARHLTGGQLEPQEPPPPSEESAAPPDADNE
jgi:hypothetical protein